VVAEVLPLPLPFDCTDVQAVRFPSLLLDMCIITQTGRMEIRRRSSGGSHPSRAMLLFEVQLESTFRVHYSTRVSVAVHQGEERGLAIQATDPSYFALEIGQ
jgi:hypothetical protein